MATLLSVWVTYYIVLFYQRHRNVLTTSKLDLALVARFAAMVVVIFISTLLLALNLAWNFNVRTLVMAAITWECAPYDPCCTPPY
jgi:hypothetical protein